MIYGVGIGPGDPELLTLKALKVLRSAERVIVPGELAGRVLDGIVDYDVVEFPMGRSEEVARRVARELVEFKGDIAFACLGDPTFYSTFQHVYEEMVRIDRDVEVEIVPGVPSFTAVLSRTKTFVDFPVLITTPGRDRYEGIIVLKASRPKEVCDWLRRLGFDRITLGRRVYMRDEAFVDCDADYDYFTVAVGLR